MPFYSNDTIVFCVNDHVVSKRFGKNPGRNARPASFRAWKLAWADWKTKSIHPLETYFQDDAVLCNPMFYFEDGTLQVSFIVSIPTETGLDMRMYEMHGPSWNSLSEPNMVCEEFTRTGFLSPRHLCLGTEKSLKLLDKTNGDRFLLTTSLIGISRATFDPDRPERILITGSGQDGVFRTLVFDIETNETLEFTGPAPMYKACLVGNRVIFSYRESEEIEDYQLCIAPLALAESDETVTIETM